MCENMAHPENGQVRFCLRGREKSSFLAAPDLTFFVFPKEAVHQVKAKKCQSLEAKVCLAGM